MITEIALFDLVAGTTRGAMIEQFKDSISRGKGGDVYLWPSVEAAEWPVPAATIVCGAGIAGPHTR